MGKTLTGWRMIIEMGHGREDMWVRCTEDWETVLKNARAEFDKQYLVGPLQYAHPRAIEIYAIYEEVTPETLYRWESKEEFDISMRIV